MRKTKPTNSLDCVLTTCARRLRNNAPDSSVLRRPPVGTTRRRHDREEFFRLRRTALGALDRGYAGSAAIVPELQNCLKGCERADSVVTNPHKWLFTPFDLSVLYCRHLDLLKRAFSLVPEYLKTNETVTNQMDYGIQLGRRFRSLKLWFVIQKSGKTV